MTISSETVRSPVYLGNDATVAFSATFKVHDADAVKVVVTNAAGIESVKVLGADYTVSGVGSAAATVTFVTAPVTGESIVIALDQSLTQAVDLTVNGAFDLKVTEMAFDRSTLQALTLREESQRSVKISITDAATFDPSIPPVSGNGNASIFLNSTATAFTFGLAADIGDAIIGVDIQAYDDSLQSLSGFPTVANRMVYSTDTDTWQELYFGAEGRALVSGLTYAAMRTTLGLGDMALLDGAAQGDIAYFDGSDWVVLTAGTAGQELISGGAGANPAWTDIPIPKTMIVWDKKANGVAAQTVSSTEVVREMTTVNHNSITGASLASNQITLLAGTYRFEVQAQARSVGNHQIVLYNATDSADLLVGMGSESNTVDGTFSYVSLIGRVTLAATKDIEVRHLVTSTGGSASFGKDGPGSRENIYLTVAIEQIS